MRNPALSIEVDRPTSRHVRQNANLLSDLLIEAITYLEGEEAAALVAKARLAASREDVANGDAPVLDHLFANLSTDQADIYATRTTGTTWQGRARPVRPRLTRLLRSTQ